MIVEKLFKGLIPWPTGKVPGNINPSMIVCRDLLKAIRKEASVAVICWWGVSEPTAKKWRKLLGVPRRTPGTIKVYGILSRRKKKTNRLWNRRR